jgi:hypothetical protein
MEVRNNRVFVPFRVAGPNGVSKIAQTSMSVSSNEDFTGREDYMPYQTAQARNRRIGSRAAGLGRGGRFTVAFRPEDLIYNGNVKLTLKEVSHG